MSQAIHRFIQLEKKKAEVKKFYEELTSSLEEVIKEIGVGAYFQDPETGCVYKTVIPEGRFVNYEKHGYVRTRRGDEKRGDLSLKEAEAAGFKEIGG